MNQVSWLRGQFPDGPPPIVVSPYDAELFGHWWFEGPRFLDFLIRKTVFDQDVVRLATPSDVLREHPEQPPPDESVDDDTPVPQPRAATLVEEGSPISLAGEGPQWASRGGIKFCNAEFDRLAQGCLDHPSP